MCFFKVTKALDILFLDERLTSSKTVVKFWGFPKDDSPIARNPFDAVSSLVSVSLILWSNEPLVFTDLDISSKDDKLHFSQHSTDLFC